MTKRFGEDNSHPGSCSFRSELAANAHLNPHALNVTFLNIIVPITIDERTDVERVLGSCTSGDLLAPTY